MTNEQQHQNHQNHQIMVEDNPFYCIEEFFTGNDLISALFAGTAALTGLFTFWTPKILKAVPIARKTPPFSWILNQTEIDEKAETLARTWQEAYYDLQDVFTPKELQALQSIPERQVKRALKSIVNKQPTLTKNLIKDQHNGLQTIGSLLIKELKK